VNPSTRQSIADMDRARNVFLAQRDSKSDHQTASNSTRRTADERQQHTLSQQLSNHAHAARAQRRAYGHLFVTSGGTREQQICDVSHRQSATRTRLREQNVQRRTNSHQPSPTTSIPNADSCSCFGPDTVSPDARRSQSTLTAPAPESHPVSNDDHAQEVRAALGRDRRLACRVARDRGPRDSTGSFESEIQTLPGITPTIVKGVPFKVIV
jgi:hypothetical protein